MPTKVTLLFDSEQIEELRDAYYRLPGKSRPDSEELGTDATREFLATKFEEKGYPTQAEEMREGQMDVNEYLDDLSVSPKGPSDAEIVAEILDRVEGVDLSL